MSKTKQKPIDKLLEEALVPEDEQPYEVPGNWVWTWTGVVHEIVTGSTPSKRNSEYYGGAFPFVKPGDLEQEDSVIEASEYLTDQGKKKSRIIPRHSTLVCCIGSIGKIGFNLVECTTNQQINSLIPDKKAIYPKYTYYFSLSPVYQSLLKASSSSTTVSIVNKSKMSKLKFVLPPLNEQKRIVDKIERLFAKIDEAKRLIEEVKESVELRRAAILDRAFRGELGTNDPNEKGMLEESNVITKRDIVPENEQLYEVPKNWIWVKAGNVTEVVGGGTPKTTVREYYENGNVPWITPADLSDFEGIYISRGQRNITSEGLRNSSAKLLPAKTVLLSSRAPIGYVAIAANLLSTNQGFKSFIPSDVIDSEYLYWYLKKSKKYLEGMGSGSTFKEISASKCKEIKIPLPPINEQKRISKRVGMLLNNLDREKEMVLEVEEKLDLLKQSILSKAFRGELGTNDPSDEHAIELLKEVLKSK
ncbi:restriction endonuclease subunit S [Anoxybacillus kestanbolensis]|uniref:restriction endonuclease subunit S n=1 Tax=Anoxybacillus kestanbolensis TaxID=227476 RepID=UPI003D2634E2